MQHTLAIRVLAAGMMALSWAGAALAADASGTWKWKFTNQSGREVEFTLTLKQDGDKLTGTLARGTSGRTSDIADGAAKDGAVSFTVTAERNGQTFTTKYKGKVEGDSIKGTTERDRNGQVVSRDWEAKKDK
jgi:hypothetical protein